MWNQPRPSRNLPPWGFPWFSRLGLAVFVVLLPSLAGCGDSSDDGTLEIAVIPKGTSSVFWKSIHAGAESAGREADVEVVWQGPPGEGNRSAQIAIVETMITKGVDGIVLAPIDDKALVGVIEEATKEGIPVIIIDSDVDTKSRVSFLATDNYLGGQYAGKRMGESLGGKGKVLMLRYTEGSASTMKRESGFLNTLESDFPDIEVVSSNQHGGADEVTARAAAENLLTSFPDVNGIFCPNETTTHGMLMALREAGLAGKVVFGGFDSSTPLIEGLEKGEIDSLIVQDPWAMGELGVTTMLRHLKGEKIEDFVDTGVAVVTKDNMKEQKMANLLTPDLSILDE